jgi:hypothetical protein
MSLSSVDMISALAPKLSDLVDAFDVEPDERPAVGKAALALYAAYQDLLAEQDLDWPPLPALAVLEQAAITAGFASYAVAVRWCIDYHATWRAWRAQMN